MATGIGADALVVSSIEFAGSEMRSQVDARLPYPDVFAELTGEFGHRNRFCASVSGGLLLVAFGSLKETASTVVRIYQLPDLSKAIHEATLANTLVTAVESTQRGWLLGLSRSVEATEAGSWELSIEEHRITGKSVEVTPVWASVQRGRISRYPPHSKEIDAFARDGRQIVALDNVLVPKFAIELMEEANGVKATHVHKLPSIANESYVQGALLKGCLVCITEYGHRGSAGHFLRVFQLQKQSLTQVQRLDEVIPRSDGYALDYDNAVLLAGGAYSGWERVVIEPDRFLLAAGERGLMLIGRENPVAGVELFPTNDACTDIKWFTERRLILLRDGNDHYVAEARDAKDGKFSISRLANAGQANRFAE